MEIRQTPAPPPAVARSAAAFEGMMIGQLVNAMFETIGSDTPGGLGESMFRGILAEKVGAEAARTGGVGLSAQVIDAMLAQQGQDK